MLGSLERDGRARATVAPTRKHYDIHRNVMENPELGSTLYTNEYHAYLSLPEVFTHEIINKLHG